MRHIVQILVFLCVLAFPSLADWNPGDSFKMHHPQLPDTNGWDISVAAPCIVADDWLCTGSGPITGIHLWVSWAADLTGVIDAIHLSIHSNIAEGTLPYSMPGEELWAADLTSNDFTWRHYADGDQGWIEINPGGYYGWTNDHHMCFQINITNFDPKPFVQEAGTIYWLDVVIHNDGGSVVGWKTSQDHFMDDAVYLCPPFEWQPLTNPIPPFESLDMAFVIDGIPEPVIIGSGMLLLLAVFRKDSILDEVP